MEIQFGYYPNVIPLVFARIATIMVTVPFFGSNQVSIPLKMAMAFVITMILLPVIPPEWTEIARGIHTLPDLVLALLSETLLGAALGFICHVFQGIVLMAGSIQGRSSSLMMARAMDPLSGTSSDIMATILQTTFVVMVLLNNGHLALLKMVSVSFTTTGHSMQWMNDDFFGLIMSVGSIMFDWGLRMALPVMCAGLIVDVCMGLITKLAPDFNVLFLSLPIRLTIGISLFGLGIRFGDEMFGRIIDQMLLRCSNVLGC